MTLSETLAAIRTEYVADYVARALEGADCRVDAQDPWTGMTEYTDAGQCIADETEEDAGARFDRILREYLAEADKFDPAGPYLDAAEHAGNEYNPGRNDDAVDAFERIGEAHGRWVDEQQPEIRMAAE